MKGLTRRIIVGITAVTGVLCLPCAAVAQSRVCATPTATGAKHAAAVKAVLTSTNPDYIAYAQAMGVTGVTASDIVTETSASVCTAVTDAIAARLHRSPPTSNYLILRAGPRFVAMDPAGEDSMLIFVSSVYDDIRVSLR